METLHIGQNMAFCQKQRKKKIHEKVLTGHSKGFPAKSRGRKGEVHPLTEEESLPRLVLDVFQDAGGTLQGTSANARTSSETTEQRLCNQPD